MVTKEKSFTKSLTFSFFYPSRAVDYETTYPRANSPRLCFVNSIVTIWGKKKLYIFYLCEVFPHLPPDFQRPLGPPWRSLSREQPQPPLSCQFQLHSVTDGVKLRKRTFCPALPPGGQSLLQHVDARSSGAGGGTVRGRWRDTCWEARHL